jgi:GMP synthase (glutamine-hydrolysing)
MNSLHPSAKSQASALLIVHQETSDPGLVGAHLKSLGYHLDIRCPSIGHALPETMEEHDAVVVFGGPMSANDDDTLPFIKQELDWIPVALESGKPFLGICLGAQMLAKTLGARVAPHPDGLREIGYFPIQPTTDGEALFEPAMHVYHWHKEGFDLPADAVLLAGGATFPHQAFRYGKATYGLQFHPEMTAAMMNLWMTKAADHLTHPGAQPRPVQEQHHARHGQTMATWLAQFMNHWLGGIVVRPQNKRSEGPTPLA